MNATVRNLLFQIHMWIGLVLGVLFVALGLSGSVLVYHDEFDGPSAPRATAIGSPASLDAIVDSARAAASHARGSVMLTMPEEQGGAVQVRFIQGFREGAPRTGERRGARAGGPPRSPTLFIDPVSTKVLATQAGGMSPLVQFAHDLHGQLFLGREGRTVVGWLGVGMVILGLTGIVLWWPKPHLWRYAFIVRRTAKGLRFHRELHAAVGIWSFIVFIAVSVTGVGIVFPETFRAMAGGGTTTGYNLRTGPEIAPIEDGERIGADDAVRLAMAALPGHSVRSVMLPARDSQAISVALSDGGVISSMVYVDPYRSRVVAVRDPATMSAGDSFVAWQRPIHDGDGTGPVWRVLIFLSGFLPLLFVVTGVTLWIRKRRARIAMTAPLGEAA
ncbi:MAG: PepSY domain-containing protein [Proteobacteria bacterium]|nr:PepSY domain-containing protein [Pseudomonadota bacterium]